MSLLQRPWPEASPPISARARHCGGAVGRAVLFKGGVSVFPDLCGTQEEMDCGGKWKWVLAQGRNNCI